MKGEGLELWHKSESRNVDPETAKIEHTGETVVEEFDRPTLDEVDLERYPDVNMQRFALQGRAREEYFLYLHGRSGLQNEIKEAMHRPRFPGETFEALLLRAIMELLRERFEKKSIQKNRKTLFTY